MAISDSKTIVRAIVPKSVAHTIGRMAKATGKSRSAIMAEFLIEAEPALKRIAGMLEVAKQQQTLFPKSTLAELEAALDHMSGQATEVLDEMTKALQLPLDGPKKARSGGRTGAQRGTGGRRAPRRKTPA